ncbi:hypothetical protein BN1723_009831 [Verticillium longisporum]|uniref:Uncharacterized protein n=1 Tax=Verticillium longisporum TaxID=100787 RepID=A0A0G4KST4_VERLO|nr:hypothetical protein BN1723_009831 [Verticillium longisporum]
MAWAQLLYLPSCVVSCWPLLCVPPSQSWSGRWFGACLSRGCSPESMRALARTRQRTLHPAISISSKHIISQYHKREDSLENTPGGLSEAKTTPPDMAFSPAYPIHKPSTPQPPAPIPIHGGDDGESDVSRDY